MIIDISTAHFDPTVLVPIVGRPNQMETVASERATTPTTTVTTTVGYQSITVIYRSTQASMTARTTTITFPEEGHAEVVIEEEEEVGERSKINEGEDSI